MADYFIISFPLLMCFNDTEYKSMKKKNSSFLAWEEENTWQKGKEVWAET